MVLSMVPRAKNGYRQYGAVEIGRLRVIRMLVRAGYSMMAILRMMLELDKDECRYKRSSPDIRYSHARMKMYLRLQINGYRP